MKMAVRDRSHTVAVLCPLAFKHDNLGNSIIGSAGQR